MIPREAALYKAIDEILWNDWDPIGVNEFPGARDEYYSYIPAIFKLKQNNADTETIARVLNEIVTGPIVLGSNMEHCRSVANKIAALEG